jgi:two-component system, cell cycle sensor histidine kinase and response regulator CckA
MVGERKILVVEDEPLAAEDIRFCLMDLGYGVAAASRGEDAMKTAEEAKPALILMDIGLKGQMDGIDAAEQIRSRLDIPVVFLTAYADEKTVARAKLTEPYGFLTKPFSERGLKAAIETAIYKHGLDRELRARETKFRVLYENAPGAYQLLDEESRVIECNGECLDLFGLTKEEILGKNFDDLLSPRSRVDFDGALSLSAFSGRPHGLDLEIQRNDGGLLPVTAHFISSVDQLGRSQWHCILHDMADRRRAEQALRESEEKYRLLIETLPMAVVIFQDGKVAFVNTAGFRMFGFAGKEEMIGRSTMSLVPEREQERLAAYAAGRRGAEATVPEYYSATLKRKTEEEFPAEISVKTVSFKGRPAEQVIVSDVTERKKTEQELQIKHNAIECCINAIAIADLDGRLTYVNPAFLSLWGYQDLGETLGLPVETLWSTGEDTQRLETSLQETGWWVGELVGRRKDGSHFDVHLSANVVKDISGLPVCVMASFMDTTEQKRIQADLIQAQRLAALGEIAGGVAHNFNNLLQVMVVSCQLAQQNAKNGNLEAIEPNLNRILESSRLGAQTVRHLQLFAGLRTTFSPQGAVFDLSDTVRRVVEMSRSRWQTIARENRVELDVKTSLQPGCRIRGTESDLVETILSLIHNSVEAMQQSGEIKIETLADDERVVLRIADSGTGIEPEHLPKIFEPFFTTKGFLRIGMGLAGSYGIISRHGGKISVESTPGEGTAFTVRLPLVEEEAQVPKREEHLASEKELCILIIDDAQDVVATLRSALKGSGQDVLTALNGSDGLKLYRENNVDVVICDLAMPEINGRQVGHEIKKLCRERGVPKTPVILLTGWGGLPEEDHRHDECGVDRIIRKPVDIDNLLAVARDLVS